MCRVLSCYIVSCVVLCVKSCYVYRRRVAKSFLINQKARSLNVINRNDGANFPAVCSVFSANKLCLTSRLCRRRPAGDLHQQCRGLVFRFKRLRRLHPSGSCVSSSEKLMNFMHFHNSSTRNRDHHILLIMTGNARKEYCHKLLLILVREHGLKHNQN